MTYFECRSPADDERHGRAHDNEDVVTDLHPEKSDHRCKVAVAIGLLILSAGCGGSDGDATPQEQGSERAEELGFETGVDPDLANSSPGDCMDAWSIASSYDTAKPVEDCSSPDAFLRITSVGPPCPEGDYADVVTADGTHVCGRVNVDLGATCSVEQPCQVDTVVVVGVGTLSDPTCGIEDFGANTGDSTLSYPADDLVLCTTIPGL